MNQQEYSKLRGALGSKGADALWSFVDSKDFVTADDVRRMIADAAPTKEEFKELERKRFWACSALFLILGVMGTLLATFVACMIWDAEKIHKFTAWVNVIADIGSP